MTRAWRCGGDGFESVTPQQAAEIARAGTGNVWIDFTEGEDQDAGAVLASLGIHPLVHDDMVEQVNRPKVDNYGGYLYLVMHTARWDGDRPFLREIDMVLGEHFLITHHDGEPRAIAAAREILPKRPELLSEGPVHLLHYILDTLVDQYLPIMDRVAEEIDALEEMLFDATNAPTSRRILSLKRGMSALRRIVGPQRDTVLALTRDEFKPIPASLRPYLRDVYDRMARVSDLLDAFRDETASLLDLHVSMVSNRLNEVIKRLTIIATIGLPLTLITGWYGMNFALPEYQLKNPYLYITAVCVGVALVTWWYLKRKEWL